MPVITDPVILAGYGRFPEAIDRDWLGRITHLSSADIGLVLRRADPVTRLGYATQLVTVRAIGTFLPDPAAAPDPVVTAVAEQLDIGDTGVLATYRDMPVRWRHTTEIRQAYGYRDFTAQPERFAFLMWLHRQAWVDEVAPSTLFRAAHRQLLARQILRPGQSVLARLVATVRERAADRVHSRLARAAGPELAAGLEKLLLVPEGQRRSELDLLRRPPFTPTITGLVRALERLERVRALGAGELDLSGIPPARIVALARYADQAWATQLADLEGQRRTAGIEENMTTVRALMRPPADPFHELLVAVYPQIRRFVPTLIEALDLEAIDSARPVLAAWRALGDWLADKPRTARRPADELPLEVVTPSWRPHVHDQQAGTVDRAGYTCCVLDQLRVRLRRRDIYAPGSTRWGDPRAELLPQRTWADRRETLCEELALDPNPAAVAGQLSAALDAAWWRTAAGYAANADLRVERRDGRDKIVLTPLDGDPEPASLVALRGEVEKLLPEVEIADLPLEVHAWTGFLGEYTHISGSEIREDGLGETLSALLVSESCNIGLTPVADETRPPLTRGRLNWAAHNYLRSATHAAGNVRLVDYHTPLPLAQAWGGGEMASADGMRFVIPVATINAAYNPRYFGRQRGSTLYSWMADTYAVFAQTLIPGTQRDSLYVLDGLIANQTGIQPEMVSTDTAGASEIVFALAWARGYRRAPRLADLPNQRLWRIDRHARYGPLNGLARHHINTRLISEHWDEICRLTASLRAGTVVPSAILRTLQRGPNPSTLARALAELGRVIKTLHVLEYAHDPVYRRTIHRLLSRGERRNALARDVFHGQRGQLRKHYQARSGQENQLDSLVIWRGEGSVRDVRSPGPCGRGRGVSGSCEFCQ